MVQGKVRSRNGDQECDANEGKSTIDARFPKTFIYFLVATGIKLKIWVVEVVEPPKMAQLQVVAKVTEVVAVAVATG